MVDVEPYVTLEAPSKVRDEQSVLSICAFSKELHLESSEKKTVCIEKCLAHLAHLCQLAAPEEQTADARPSFSIQWRPAEKNRAWTAA